MKLLLPQEYQPRLCALFRCIALEVRGNLPYARVEHIGSSAIPSAISKGDLDIFVGVPPGRFSRSITRLERVGYSEKLDTLRTDSLCMLVTSKYACDVAIQLVANGTYFEMFLEFRDALRQDARLVAEYNAVKRHSEHLDEDEYRSNKAAFIERVLATRRVQPP